MWFSLYLSCLGFAEFLESGNRVIHQFWKVLSHYLFKITSVHYLSSLLLEPNAMFLVQSLFLHVSHMCVLQFGYLLLTCLSSITPSSVVCSLMSEPSRELSSRIHLHLCVDSHISTEMLHLLIYFSCFSIFSLNNNHSYFKFLIYKFKQLAYLCFCFYCLLFPLINGHISFFSCLLIFIA